MSACNAGDPGSIPGLGRSSGEGNGNPFQYSCLEKSHGRRSLGGCSLLGRKELDTITLASMWIICSGKTRIKMGRILKRLLQS